MDTATAVVAEVKRLVQNLGREEREQAIDMIESWVSDDESHEVEDDDDSTLDIET